MQVLERLLPSGTSFASTPLTSTSASLSVWVSDASAFLTSMPIASSGMLSILVRMLESFASMLANPPGTTGSSSGSCVPVELRLRRIGDVFERDVQLAGEEAAGLELRAQPALLHHLPQQPQPRASS